MKTIAKLLIIFTTLFIIACNPQEKTSKEDKKYTSPVKEMTDEEYPDNNDKENRCTDWEQYKHHKTEIIRLDSLHFKVIFYPSNDNSDTIILDSIRLLEWIPTIPDYIKDDYLKKIGIINAEWNRQQVKFKEGEFYISKNTPEGQKTVRVDLARNCLNSYLWEIITYGKENNKTKPLYHGWFDFPRELYRQLFDEVNQGKLTFDQYKDYLLDYQEPESKYIDLSLLRTVDTAWEISFQNHNDKFYPLTGARKSKFKNIVYPKNPKTINDFLTDSTKFATFLYPGYYSTSDPRSTTLSQLAIPQKVIIRKVTSHNSTHDKCLEIDVTFASKTDTNLLTRVVIGGIKPELIPQLKEEDYNNGYKMPMGIGNHPFYEPLKKAQQNPTSNNPYYAFILDNEGKWIDSHYFGIDGPLFHRDINDYNLLHYWLLSFERHAMVCHLTFPLNQPVK